MADETPETPPGERGRYAMYSPPDGSLVVARATGLCESCTSCGCGQQADPVIIPAEIVDITCDGCGKPVDPMRLIPGLVSWGRAARGMGGKLAMLKTLAGGGNGK